MSGAPSTLARRYARALLDVAERRGGGESLALRDELRAFWPLVSGHPGLVRALLDPGLGPEPRRRVLAAVAEGAGASELLRRLVDVLASRDRVALFPDVALAYAEVANAARGIVSAEAVSAVTLPEEQVRALERALGGAVELTTRVDADLVGGLLVRTGGRTYDGTVRTRLRALRRRLAVTGPGSSARAS